MLVPERARAARPRRSGVEAPRSRAGDGGASAESRNINLSLHYLEQVVRALRDGADEPRHVPYRNCVLTSMLRDSLGGNCRTALVACASAARDHAAESTATCRFALRCGDVRAVDVVANVDVDPRDAALASYRAEADKLRAAAVARDADLAEASAQAAIAMRLASSFEAKASGLQRRLDEATARLEAVPARRDSRRDRSYSEDSEGRGPPAAPLAPTGAAAAEEPAKENLAPPPRREAAAAKRRASAGPPAPPPERLRAEMLQRGRALLKHGRRGGVYVRFVWVSPEDARLCWRKFGGGGDHAAEDDADPTSDAASGFVSLRDYAHVQPAAGGRKRDDLATCALTLHAAAGAKHRALTLQFDAGAAAASAKVRDDWLTALREAIDAARDLVL